MVSLWYFNGILMVFIWYLYRRKSVVKRDYQQGEKHGDSKGKMNSCVKIWSCQIFCLFLHVEYQTNNINPQNLYNKKQKVKRN